MLLFYAFAFLVGALAVERNEPILPSNDSDEGETESGQNPIYMDDPPQQPPKPDIAAPPPQLVQNPQDNLPGHVPIAGTFEMYWGEYGLPPQESTQGGFISSRPYYPGGNSWSSGGGYSTSGGYGLPDYPEESSSSGMSSSMLGGLAGDSYFGRDINYGGGNSFGGIQEQAVDYSASGGSSLAYPGPYPLNPVTPAPFSPIGIPPKTNFGMGQTAYYSSSGVLQPYPAPYTPGQYLSTGIAPPRNRPHSLPSVDRYIASSSKVLQPSIPGISSALSSSSSSSYYSVGKFGEIIPQPSDSVYESYSFGNNPLSKLPQPFYSSEVSYQKLPYPSNAGSYVASGKIPVQRPSQYFTNYAALGKMYPKNIPFSPNIPRPYSPIGIPGQFQPKINPKQSPKIFPIPYSSSGIPLSYPQEIVSRPYSQLYSPGPYPLPFNAAALTNGHIPDSLMYSYIGASEAYRPPFPPSYPRPLLAPFTSGNHNIERFVSTSSGTNTNTGTFAASQSKTTNPSAASQYSYGYYPSKGTSSTSTMTASKGVGLPIDESYYSQGQISNSMSQPFVSQADGIPFPPSRNPSPIPIDMIHCYPNRYVMDPSGKSLRAVPPPYVKEMRCVFNWKSPNSKKPNLQLIPISEGFLVAKGKVTVGGKGSAVKPCPKTEEEGKTPKPSYRKPTPSPFGTILFFNHATKKPGGRAGKVPEDATEKPQKKKQKGSTTTLGPDRGVSKKTKTTSTPMPGELGSTLEPEKHSKSSKEDVTTPGTHKDGFAASTSLTGGGQNNKEGITPPSKRRRNSILNQSFPPQPFPMPMNKKMFMRMGASPLAKRGRFLKHKKNQMRRGVPQKRKKKKKGRKKKGRKGKKKGRKGKKKG